MVALRVEEVRRAAPLEPGAAEELDSGRLEPFHFRIEIVDLERQREGVRARQREVELRAEPRVVEELDPAARSGRELRPVLAAAVAGPGVDVRLLEAEYVALEGEQRREVLDVEEAQPESHACPNGSRTSSIPRLREQGRLRGA